MSSKKRKNVRETLKKREKRKQNTHWNFLITYEDEAGEQKQVSRTINQNRLDNFRKHLQLLLGFDLSFRGHTFHGAKQILRAQAMRDPYREVCAEDKSEEEWEEWVDDFYFDIFRSVLTAKGQGLWTGSAPVTIQPKHIETKYLDVNEVLSTLPNDVLPASVISIEAKGKVDIQHCIQERGYINKASLVLKAEWGTPHNSKDEKAERGARDCFTEFMVDCIFDGVDQAQLKFEEVLPEDSIDILQTLARHLLEDPSHAERFSKMLEKGREYTSEVIRRDIFTPIVHLEPDETEYSQWFSLVECSVNDPHAGDWELYCLAV